MAMTAQSTPYLELLAMLSVDYPDCCSVTPSANGFYCKIEHMMNSSGTIQNCGDLHGYATVSMFQSLL